ncbi:MAG TPA: response regulator [Rhizomicrobium sp.]|jgi:CheY-like chemotaxis protein|nr:response regulator [Rhizomicrobium sp.]
MTGRPEALRGRRVLVIEDEYLIAQVLVDLLEEAGAQVIGPIGGVDEALTFVADTSHHFDGAVIDLNLHGRKSYPVADALAARSIKFVFATGYGADAVDGPYRCYPRCEKPFNQTTLVGLLGELLS